MWTHHSIRPLQLTSTLFISITELSRNLNNILIINKDIFRTPIKLSFATLHFYFKDTKLG